VCSIRGTAVTVSTGKSISTGTTLTRTFPMESTTTTSTSATIKTGTSKPVKVPIADGTMMKKHLHDPQNASVLKTPKFLRCLYEILHTEDHRIIGWSSDGACFQVYKMDALEKQILPKYFKHGKFASFQRQLNNFGFRKWTKTRSSVCTFSHDIFIKRHPEYLNELVKKYIQVEAKVNGNTISTSTISSSFSSFSSSSSSSCKTRQIVKNQQQQQQVEGKKKDKKDEEETNEKQNQNKKRHRVDDHHKVSIKLIKPFNNFSSSLPYEKAVNKKKLSSSSNTSTTMMMMTPTPPSTFFSTTTTSTSTSTPSPSTSTSTSQKQLINEVMLLFEPSSSSSSSSLATLNPWEMDLSDFWAFENWSDSCSTRNRKNSSNNNCTTGSRKEIQSSKEDDVQQDIKEEEEEEKSHCTMAILDEIDAFFF
jgi:hypothetical protein